MTEQVLFSLPLERLEPIFKKWVRDVVSDAIPKKRENKEEIGRDIPLPIQEAAKIIGKSVPTLYDYVHRGILPHMKRGQRLYFYRSELISWIEAGRVKTKDEIKQAALESLEK